MFITFAEIVPIWSRYLWPNRVSKIESHSCMTWPGNSNVEYDPLIFLQPVYFWGIKKAGHIVAVNSGHLTNEKEFRSRGLWVHPLYRNTGLASTMLTDLIGCARRSKATMVWSIPRLSSLPVYEKVGFVSTELEFKTATEFGPNVYCKLDL